MKTRHQTCMLRIAAACIFFISALSTAQAKSTDKQLSQNQLRAAYHELLGAKRNRGVNAGKKTRTKTGLKRAALSAPKKAPARYHAVRVARQQLRKRYRWGGTSPKRGFDCSGLMQYAYKKASVRLPRTAAAQYRSTKRVSLSRLQTGDLIFFHTRRSRTRVNHVGIYLGGGKFIHAPRRGKRVSVSTLNRYWKRRAVGAGRVS